MGAVVVVFLRLVDDDIHEFNDCGIDNTRILVGYKAWTGMTSPIFGETRNMTWSPSKNAACQNKSAMYILAVLDCVARSGRIEPQHDRRAPRS